MPGTAMPSNTTGNIMMKSILFAATAALALATSAQAIPSAPINAPVPTANYIHFGGLDWA